MADYSSGYESIASSYISTRGRAVDGIGSSTVREWAKTLSKGATVLDIGCGTGIPVTKILVDEGLSVYAVDGSPSMVDVFRQNFPSIPVVTESVEQSAFFNRSFDAIIAVGLIFLLSEEAQRALIPKMAAALNPGGRLLFTTPVQVAEWKDTMTGRLSRSLGRECYTALLSGSGMTIIGESEDEGGNHYFDAIL